MPHDLLGEARLTDCHLYDAVTKIRFGQLTVQVRLARDTQPLEDLLNLAADVVRRLKELDQLARRIAIKELLKTYNNGWNEYDEAQDDGSIKSVSNPKLSEAEFDAKLSLNTISICGVSSIAFFYDDEGMFWGHSLVIESQDGLDFSNAHAELVGSLVGLA